MVETPPVSRTAPNVDRATCCELTRHHGADVSESLNRHTLPGDLPAEVLEQPLGEKTAPGRGLAPAGGPADHDRLAGDDLGPGMADLLL